MIKKRSVIYGLLLSVSGFLIAALLNALIPITAPVEIVDYPVGSAFININIAYRIVLFFLAALFLILGLISLKDHDKWKKFAKGAPLRFASGIGLLLWDLLGTKWQLLPQPFFPGPAGIIEAFLIEPQFVLENTLYSLRLYAAGFVLGVVFGVGTGSDTFRSCGIPYRDLRMVPGYEPYCAGHQVNAEGTVRSCKDTWFKHI